MDERREPKLRTVEKYKPPFPLNDFPKDFAFRLGREAVYLIATRPSARLEGQDWEEIFARLVGANWQPSNNGLDDIVLEQTAWGAKTVYASKPQRQKRVRLISGRNSPIYSFGAREIGIHSDPSEIGRNILSIWNERVSAIRQHYKHLRTVVLVKSKNLLELAVFEFDTIRYLEDDYEWKWNIKGNLEGHSKNCDAGTGHKFTWQPHGSQFTIIEEVTKERLCLLIKQPPRLDPATLLESIKFDRSWVEVID
jgi:hypothetical protein